MISWKDLIPNSKWIHKEKGLLRTLMICEDDWYLKDENNLRDEPQYVKYKTNSICVILKEYDLQ